MLPNPLVVSIDIRRTERGRAEIVVVSHDHEGIPMQRSRRVISATLIVALAQASVMAVEMLPGLDKRKKATRPADD